MSKHTQGPWKYGIELSSRSGEWLISFDAGYRGRGIDIAETRPGSGQEEANARLIAAAPELLDALQDMIDYYGSASATVEALTAARAAIAKAKGEKE